MEKPQTEIPAHQAGERRSITKTQNTTPIDIDLSDWQLGIADHITTDLFGVTAGDAYLRYDPGIAFSEQSEGCSVN